MNNSKKDQPIATCPSCRAVYYEVYSATLGCRCQRVEHLPDWAGMGHE
jgi:hypothetical protein